MIVRDAVETIDRLLKSIFTRENGMLPFDEYVFVDTGSVDRTCDQITDAIHGLYNHGHVYWPSRDGDGPMQFSLPIDSGYGHTLFTIAHFGWIDDFAAARNYSFGLGTARWRMWLDADDELPGASKIRPTIRKIEASNQHVNVVRMPYRYTPTFTQDKFRVMRWGDGWTWIDEIHESPQRSFPAPRISASTDIVVYHGGVAGERPDHLDTRSRERDLRICSKIKARAIADGDLAKAGLMDYYLGLYARAAAILSGDQSKIDDAVGYWNACANALGRGSNIGAMALSSIAEVELLGGRHERAIEAASRIFASMPERPDGKELLACTLSAAGDHYRAAILFDQLRTDTRVASIRDVDDVVSIGMPRAAAATSYLALGRPDDAIRARSEIPDSIRHDGRIAHLVRAADVGIARARGLVALKGYVDYLIQDCQAPIALEILTSGLIPAAIADHPGVDATIRMLQTRLKHLDSWDAYKETYASIPEDVYRGTAVDVKVFGRAVAAIRWAELATPQDSEGIIRVCSIGFQEGTIEAEMLRVNPAIQMCLCDVAPQASAGLRRLSEAFPGRVKGRAIVRNHYDWSDFDEHYDCVMMYEVLEHLPRADEALCAIRSMLKPGGTMLLSTPVAAHWVEPYLSAVGSPACPPFWGHVRAFNPSQLHTALRDAGFRFGRLSATEGGAIFLAEMQKREEVTTKGFLTVVVPSTPQPFDADAHLRGHIGGSEEAVIHLTAELGRRGWDVTIFAPRPDRPDGTVIHAQDGVLYCDIGDFDADGKHGQILVWRSPQLAAQLAKIEGNVVYNWLHDAAY